jgi:hypothetical protein
MNRLLFPIAGTVFIVLAALLGYEFGRRADRSRYEKGFESGVKSALDELEYGRSFGLKSVGVPLYQGGEPCAILFIEYDIAEDAETRHVTIRKAGCGAHWDMKPDQEIERSGIVFGTKPDFIPDLLRDAPQ